MVIGNRVWSCILTFQKEHQQKTVTRNLSAVGRGKARDGRKAGI